MYNKCVQNSDFAGFQNQNTTKNVKSLKYSGNYPIFIEKAGF
jgi:hypothetical protein